MRVLTLLLISVSVFAGDFQERSVSFGLDSWTPNGRVFYNCDSVEDITYKILSDMRAKDIDIYCTGGIGQGGWWRPAHVSANFKAINSNAEGDVEGSWERFTIEEWEGCHLNNQIFENIISSFDERGWNASSCFSSNDMTRI